MVPMVEGRLVERYRELLEAPPRTTGLEEFYKWKQSLQEIREEIDGQTRGCLLGAVLAAMTAIRVGGASLLIGLGSLTQAEFALDLGVRNPFATGERSSDAVQCLRGLGGDFLFFHWRLGERTGEWPCSFRCG